MISVWLHSTARADGSLCFRIALAILWCHALIILRSTASSRTHLKCVTQCQSKWCYSSWWCPSYSPNGALRSLLAASWHQARSTWSSACRMITVRHQSTARAIRKQSDPMHSNRSRGTLMSYGDHSAQRHFKSNAPTVSPSTLACVTQLI